MEIECVGKKVGDDHVLIDRSLIEQTKIGEMIKLKIIVPDQKEKRGKKELSPATKRLLKRMENAKPIGVPDDPEEISHSRLAEERMEEKYPIINREDSLSEAFLRIAEQDWTDWADPEEDIYEGYRRYAEKG